MADPSSATTTVTMDADKTVTANFSLIPDNTPPTISETSSSNVTRTSADIAWTTDESGDSQVEYWASPSQLTPLDATMVTEHLVHLTDLNPNTLYHYKVMSRDGAGNLAVSAEFTFTTLATPATFVTSGWDISLSKVDTGDQVTVGFTVTNTGELGGSYQATFTVNGTAESTEELNLTAGDSETVDFTTTKSAAGTYLVSVGGLSFSFEVKEEAAPPPPPHQGINWWLILGVAAGSVLLTLGIVLLARRDRIKALVPAPLRAKPSQDVTESLARARQEARTAEESVRREVSGRARQEAEYKKVSEAEEKARMTAAEAREAWAVGAEAKQVRPVEGQRLAAGVLTVTALAAEKLREGIRAKTQDPDASFRITRSPDKPNQLKMALDRAKKEDQVVESGGMKILVISPELVPSLEGMVIDYQETPHGAGFTITKSSPDKK